MKKRAFPYLVIIFGLFVFFSCRKEDEFTSDTAARLQFSSDSLFFDTVFSRFGTDAPVSVTKQLWVINNNDKGVHVNIHVKGTANGSLKINVDGKPTDAINDKEIRGHDSIVIFVQLYSNPGNDFIVADQILFETNGNLQDVDIVGYGRDAYYHNNEVITGPGGNIEWTNDKPHVIYDSVLVPKGQILTIRQGAKIYSHVKSVLLVQGTLIIEGTAADPVIMGGDRLDKGYYSIPGQWIGIRILPGSKDNVIKGAIIKDGYIGLEVDSASSNSNPNLYITQSIIQNMSAAGLVCYSAEVVAINNVISDCGQFTFYGALGGNYTLYQNTFAAYSTDFNIQNPQVVLDNSPYTNEQGQVILQFALTAKLKNNIIYGSQEEQLLLNNNLNGNQDVSVGIQGCLIRTQIKELSGGTNIINQDPVFESFAEHKYTLKPVSPALAKGVFSGVSVDLNNKPRNTTAPTIGAYE